MGWTLSIFGHADEGTPRWQHIMKLNYKHLLFYGSELSTFHLLHPLELFPEREINNCFLWALVFWNLFTADWPNKNNILCFKHSLNFLSLRSKKQLNNKSRWWKCWSHYVFIQCAYFIVCDTSILEGHSSLPVEFFSNSYTLTPKLFLLQLYNNLNHYVQRKYLCFFESLKLYFSDFLIFIFLHFPRQSSHRTIFYFDSYDIVTCLLLIR